MSLQKAEEAECTSPETCPDVETVIVPRSQDIGDFEVRRVLQSIRRRMVGPFVFFDHFGPTVLAAGAMGFKSDVPEAMPQAADLADCYQRRDSVFGRLDHLAPALSLSATLPGWDRPPVPPGTDQPVWL